MNTQDDFRAYAVGIVHASVCTSLSDDEATQRLNQKHPTGLAHGWSISDSETFKCGKPNPCPCDESPETHRHILFNC